MCQSADQLGVSSLHLTFNTAEEAKSLREVGYLQRSGIQYHWENRNYITFEDFLADLKQSKRKNIRQVRVPPNAGLKIWCKLTHCVHTPVSLDMQLPFPRNSVPGRVDTTVLHLAWHMPLLLRTVSCLHDQHFKLTPTPGKHCSKARTAAQQQHACNCRSARAWPMLVYGSGV